MSNNLYPNFSFDVQERLAGSMARRGTLKTPHGTIETPAFIFCATKGAMKGVHMADVKAADTQIILSNTYHLMLSPGADLVAKMGGIHKFTGWSGPMLTDSGGFQIFSLGHGTVASEIKGKRGEYEPQDTLENYGRGGRRLDPTSMGKNIHLHPKNPSRFRQSSART